MVKWTLSTPGAQDPYSGEEGVPIEGYMSDPETMSVNSGPTLDDHFSHAFVNYGSSIPLDPMTGVLANNGANDGAQDLPNRMALAVECYSPGSNGQNSSYVTESGLAHDAGHAALSALGASPIAVSSEYPAELTYNIVECNSSQHSDFLHENNTWVYEDALTAGSCLNHPVTTSQPDAHTWQRSRAFSGPINNQDQITPLPSDHQRCPIHMDLHSQHPVVQHFHTSYPSFSHGREVLGARTEASTHPSNLVAFRRHSDFVPPHVSQYGYSPIQPVDDIQLSNRFSPLSTATSHQSADLIGTGINPEIRKLATLASMSAPVSTTKLNESEALSSYNATSEVLSAIDPETEPARKDRLYRVDPHSDGHYYCPFTKQEQCRHEPTKLKCEYDKYIDSHLKPYRCKFPGCQALKFSSTACRLRHEREAHGSHGHGFRPYLCNVPGCDRAQPGQGFPRSWNRDDHMRRVHSEASPETINSSQDVPERLLGGGGRKRAAPHKISVTSGKRHRSKEGSHRRGATEANAAESNKTKETRKGLQTQWVDCYRAFHEHFHRLHSPYELQILQQLQEDAATLYDLSIQLYQFK